MKKVVLGLSGGVDSAVAAILLKEQGFEVHGLYLDFGCGDVCDAEKAASELDITFNVSDLSNELDEKVKTPFVNAYLNGITPNPCVICNPAVKFPALLREADRIGADFIATGHYAIVSRNGNRYALLASPFPNDQSYMLCRLTQNILARLLLPLGMLPKVQVRSAALSHGLSLSQKPDSMEICFIPSGDYTAFIESRAQAPSPGLFTTPSGSVLGTHKGIHFYTVGQRRGLGISSSERLFVSAIEPSANRVILSGADDMMTASIAVTDLHWLSVPPPSLPFRAQVKVRHSKTAYYAEITPTADGALITFDSPIKHPAPGQAAVFYNESMLLGSGTIFRYKQLAENLPPNRIQD